MRPKESPKREGEKGLEKKCENIVDSNEAREEGRGLVC